jgi:hypothetical protein
VDKARKKDAHENYVVKGTAVTFTTILGNLPIAPYTTTTLSGVATATLTSSTTVGMAMVIATVGTGDDQTTVTFEVSSSPTITSLLAGGNERILIERWY